MIQDKFRQFITLATVILVIIVNALANALPINGQTSGEVSDSVPTLVTPAGYVFAIWGVIYVTLIAFAIYQALPSQAENPRLRKIGHLFVLSNIANISWIFMWHYELFILSLVAITILLLSLISIYQRLNIGLSQPQLRERLLVDSPFSIYLAWISIATIANFAVVLSAHDWRAFGIAHETWAAIMLMVATTLTASMIMFRTEVLYAAVIVWAFIGIMINHQDVTPVVIFAGIGIIVIAGVLAIRTASILLNNTCTARIIQRQR